MDKIIPYDRDYFGYGGAFIKPDGNIIYLNGGHDSTAKYYCFGRQYDILYRLKSGLPCYTFTFEDYKATSGLKGNREDINEFESSKLTPEQLELFKLWRQCEVGENTYYTSAWSDFLVFVLSFDKLETVKGKGIMTTCLNPHTRFYNYYLMDWEIEDFYPKVYNSETGRFEGRMNESWSLISERDEKVADEIEEIKRKVLINDRHLFFK